MGLKSLLNSLKPMIGCLNVNQFAVVREFIFYKGILKLAIIVTTNIEAILYQLFNSGFGNRVLSL